MTKKIGILLVVLLVLAIAAPSFAGSFRVIRADDYSIRVQYNLGQGYFGCSYWVRGTRHDLEAQHAVGQSNLSFDVPKGARWTVALWGNRYNSGSGPDPNNGWGKKNGYYLYKEMGRKDGNY